ncbi:helix-turn-helix domain-containing protein [Massilia sp. R2A-15]|uniref:helix-turn-helix domain-containing protein n=1 Tax=Massilia sp. R2A-15 TaxID=3064278 RepID=UPI0027353D30|nr:helix-turn-helix domain-containing protein [Massilia sp. R2A-15]WLI89311.1 helix-turn-helix domain-containing protein [Massilia sp. R2A-15]
MPTCPDPFERAPRADLQGAASAGWLRLPPPSLQGALVALLGRDTSTLPLSSAQRLSHFPASPLVTISWYRGLDVGLIARGEHGHVWQAFGAPVVISGTQSHPCVSWAPTTGAGYMACFNADAAQALFGLDLAAIQDRFVPAGKVIGDEFAPLWDALHASADDDVLAVLETHLGRRWQALQGRESAQASLRQLGRNWVERLAWQAQDWARVHSARHVERRIKSFSGRSLREWQSLVRTEGLFFAARDRHDTGQPFDWAALALDEGFADQAHMSRMAKRITGFSPTEFAQRFIEDESFWMYRLWV